MSKTTERLIQILLGCIIFVIASPIFYFVILFGAGGILKLLGYS